MTLPVVKEKLLSLQDSSLGEDSDAVVSVHHHHCNGSKHGISFRPTTAVRDGTAADSPLA